MRVKKSLGVISLTGVIRLVTHAMMGVALGLAFGLALVLTNPAVTNLVHDGGGSAVIVFLLTLVMTFAIGATLTGVIFILAEDKES